MDASFMRSVSMNYPVGRRASQCRSMRNWLEVIDDVTPASRIVIRNMMPTLLRLSTSINSE